MEQPITLQQFIFGIITTIVVALAPQFYTIYNRRLEAQEKKREADEAARDKERDDKEKERVASEVAEETTWKRVISEYERTIERAHHLEEENAQLRPLALQNAVLEQKMRQCAEDKTDWKDHALRLEEQLQDHNIIPLPFRRNPREDTGEQLRTVSRKMKAIKDDHQQSSATSDSPTLVFPPVEKKDV